MPFDIAKTVLHRIKSLRRHPALNAFMEHNRRIFSVKVKAKKPAPVILFELNAMHSAHIAYSYMANVLATENGAEIKAYFQRTHDGILQRLSAQLRRVFSADVFGAYRSFGTNEFIEIRLSADQELKARELWADTLTRLQCTLDVQALTINGVWVGDLIYDTYLMKNRKPTIVIGDEDFSQSLLASLRIFVFWEGYFASHDVRAVSVSHCVYTLAMPLRIALQRGVPAFQTNATNIYCLNLNNFFAYNDFVSFPERFATLPSDVQAAGLAEAKRRIARRFAGEVGVDMAYSTKSAYSASRHQRLLRESSKKKILIATHCFFDSPHSYGNNTFPDFYEWLDFLGQMTDRTDYDWYIKMHPDYLPGTKEIVDDFVMRYPKFSLLPSDASHHQIISEGIDLALTSYGTIAFEYAALGIPVINASQNNPHIAYGFNLHAKDVEDYRRLLMDPELWGWGIDQQQVYEYYFMRYIYNTENLFFENYDKTIDDLGGYDAQFTPAVYEKWLDEWSPERHQTILSAIRQFIKSGDFRMDYTHYGKEFSVALIEVTD